MPTPSPIHRRSANLIIYLLIAMLAIVWLRETWVARQDVRAVPYSEFQRLLKDGQVTSVRIAGDTVVAELRTALPDGSAKVTATRVDPAFAQELDGYGVEYEQTLEKTWVRDILSWFVPLLVFLGLWLLVLRRLAGRGGEMLTIGKSKARVYRKRTPGSPSTMWQAWTKPSPSCRRS